ncbi:MAG: hypothetical protein PWQ91_336 [Eubacteriales bacterium]|nr:hypothetical protein [Eubacteriales bacterium]
MNREKIRLLLITAIVLFLAWLVFHLPVGGNLVVFLWVAGNILLWAQGGPVPFFISQGATALSAWTAGVEIKDLVLFLLLYAFPAAVGGRELKREDKIRLLRVPGAVALAVLTAVLFLVFWDQEKMAAIKTNFFVRPEEVLVQLQQSGMVNLLGQKGASTEDLQTLAEEISRFLATFYYLLPGFSVVWQSLFILAAFYFAAYVFRRWSAERVGQFPAFSSWRLSWPFLWLFIAGIILELAGSYFSLFTVQTLGRNLLVVAVPLFIAAGGAVLAGLWQQGRLGRGMKVFLVLIGVLLPQGLLILLLLLGLFDPYVDFRRRRSGGTIGG